jgi:transposase
LSFEARTYVEVSVSETTLDVAVSTTGRSCVFSNDETGIGQLVGKLRDEVRPILVVLEATGGFECLVAAALVTSGIAVAVIKPKQLRDFAEATGRLAKTDALDAAVLARSAEAVCPVPKTLPNAEAREFSAILVRRSQII